MKKSFFTVLSILLTIAVFGQTPRKDALEQKIKSLRIAFITEKLSLTPAESEKFWPLFNQMDAERQTLNQDRKVDFDQPGSDKDAQAYLSKYFEIKEKEMQIEKRFVEKLKGVLPVSKIAKLLWIEKQFRQEIMSNIINKRKERKGK